MSNPSTVLVVGGTGTLGSAVVDALLAFNTTTHIRILARKSNDELLKKGNGRVSFVSGDLINSDLSEAVRGVDAVVSCIIGDEKVTVDGQKRLIDASKAAGVKQFIPSSFSVDYRHAKLGDHPNWDQRKHVDEYLIKSGVGWTIVNMGIFVDVLLMPGFLGVLDVFQKKVTYWGTDADSKIDVTTYADTGKIVAAALYDSKALNAYLGVAGDSISVREMYETLKSLDASATLSSLGSIEDREAKIGELFAKNDWNSVMPLLYSRGLYYHASPEESNKNRKPYSDIKFTTMREALAGVLQDAKNWIRGPKTYAQQ